MSKMNLGEIFAVLTENKIRVASFAESNSITGIGSIRTVQKAEYPKGSSYNDSPYEQGFDETFYLVRHIVDHDIYVKIAVTLDSYAEESYQYGYGVEVFPKEKTIMVYE